MSDDDEVRRREIGLFRYSLIREPADPALTPRQRGRLVRQIAAAEHLAPDGRRVRVSRATLDRWIRWWRNGGFAALVPPPRVGVPLTPAEVLARAEALKREAPARTAAQITAILAAVDGASLHPRTLQRHFVRVGLNRRPDGSPTPVWGRFEAERRNDLWVGDALHGPGVGGRKSYLFAFLDDHSRLAVGYRWGIAEDVVRLEAALRSGLSSRGIPSRIYVDNGSAFVSRQLLKICATLGIRLVHSRPGKPQGRGKIERFFHTVETQFVVEIAPRGGVETLAEMNRLFAAWVEHVYHRRVHSETGQSPLERFGVEPPPTPTPAELHDAFLWSETRTVDKTACVRIYGNVYEVDAALAGQRVQLVFDPFDLTDIDVRWDSRPFGKAVPHRIGRHVHPQARPEPAPEPPPPTGIDYLGLIAARHDDSLERRIDYRQLQIPDKTLAGFAHPHPHHPDNQHPDNQHPDNDEEDKR